MSDAQDTVAERDRVRRALDDLPVRQRAVVLLRFYDDLAEPAIAALLGIRTGTVKSQLARGLARLRGNLATEEDRDGGR